MLELEYRFLGLSVFAFLLYLIKCLTRFYTLRSAVICSAPLVICSAMFSWSLLFWSITWSLCSALFAMYSGRSALGRLALFWSVQRENEKQRAKRVTKKRFFFLVDQRTAKKTESREKENIRIAPTRTWKESMITSNYLLLRLKENIFYFIINEIDNQKMSRAFCDR